MSEQKYFYIENGNQVGPVSTEELLSKIGPSTEIWCPGMDNWAPANTVPEISALLGGGVAAPAPSVPDPAATSYTGGTGGDYNSGNSQNYGNSGYANNPSYGNQQQPNFGNQQQPYGNQQQPYGNQQPNFGNQQGMPTGNKPDNYLVWAILSTLFCCWPVGIVSIVNAAKVDAEWNKGNYAEAQKCSDNAKKFATISAIVGAIFIVIYIVLVFAGAVSGM